MKVTNHFVQGKMNKDIDERFLPKGQYAHAENVRVANSDGSDVGAVENVRGNEQLTNFGLTNAMTIGTYPDGSNQKLYWLVTSDEKDLVLEYDFSNSLLSVLLESTKPDGVLNFDRDHLVTGIVKIINGDSDKDLLIWTDDLNGIRKINIERSKGYIVDGFTEDEISLIKKPPRFAPKATLTYTGSLIENDIEDSFYSFSYRYKYLDGEFSALSSYTNYKFAPNDSKIDFQTMENEGMVNAFNAIKIEFNTGDKTVTDIQLVVKESNSSGLAIVETFNKSDEGWLDSTTQSFVFANSKKYLYLPEKELYRPYDNVPRLAKAMELINNRVIFGNYVEGYDLINSFGEDIVIDYELSLLSKDLTGVDVPLTFALSNVIDDTMVIDLAGLNLSSNSRLSLDVKLEQTTYSGLYANLFSFIINNGFTDATGLATDTDFIYFVEEVMTSHFLANYNAIPPADSIVLTTTGFSIVSSTATTISIKAPTITYRIDNTPLDTLDFDFTDIVSNYTYQPLSAAFFRDIAINSSLKTNRSYEIGIIYMDEYGRSTTVITDKNNTIQIPQEFSGNQNVIIVNLNNQPPAFADRYKLVVKQNKSEYQTIYTNIFYEDGLFRWVKLEGANKDKVQEGDTLIVKSDLGGIVRDVIKVRVLEVAVKAEDFIVGNTNESGDDIIEEQGLYMKIKPTGFDMSFTSATARTFEGSSHLRYPTQSDTLTQPSFGTGSIATANFVPYKIGAGTSVRLFIEFRAWGAIEYRETFDKTFRSNGDYLSMEDWFNAEVVDLGSFGTEFTSSFGFTTGGEHFAIRAHRDGTASRSISTTVKFEVLFSEGVVIFETEPKDTDNNIYYETEQTFEIINGYHQGNVQSQSVSEGTAIIEMDFFNCYSQGNGAESYRYKDAFNKNFLNIDLRPSTTSVEKFKEIRRFSELTYSAPYNENTSLNGLGEFNLSTLNYKEDIDKKYGFIQKLYAKDTDILVFQEDKVSRVLYGKDLLMNADGTSNITSTESILGQQIPYAGEYGISRNPESFAFDANNIYFADAKRGCVCRLSLNGITEISMAGMINFFKDSYKGSINTRKLGAYDPYYDQYVIHNDDNTIAASFNIACSESLIRNGFFGVAYLNIDYGVLIGDAGFNYSSNGVPIKYDIDYNGTLYSTGYVGDSSYNAELATLGLPPVSGVGTGVFTFPKGLSVPKIATVTITAPISGANFQIDGNCVAADTISVTSIVLNGVADEGLNIKSRYRWSNATYLSSFRTFNNFFETGDVDIFDLFVGAEGSTQVPLTDSVVELQSYKGYAETAQFNTDDRMGYLISSTFYAEVDLDTILSLATFPTPTTVVGLGGSVTNSASFPFTRALGESYLYLIWDYRGQTILVNDTTTVDNAGNVIVPVLSNDTIIGTPVVTIFTPAVNGIAVVNLDNTVTYTHDGSATLTDSFVYQVFDGTNYNTATVNVTVNAVAPPSELTITSSFPNAGTGTVDFLGGQPFEVLTLSFVVTADPSFSDLLFDDPCIAVPPLTSTQLTRTGYATLDANGSGVSIYTFSPADNTSSCLITITGRSSGLPIPVANSTNV